VAHAFAALYPCPSLLDARCFSAGRSRNPFGRVRRIALGQEKDRTVCFCAQHPKGILGEDYANPRDYLGGPRKSKPDVVATAAGVSNRGMERILR